MAYTVKQVAAISGVSVRTLHFYDETGLLEPAFLGANGYRYYEEPQLLKLQQILFYRELGFELKQIKPILDRAEFKNVSALQAHREVLQAALDRTRGLLETIDKTIRHLKGEGEMSGEEIFAGFVLGSGQDRFAEHLRIAGQANDCKLSGADTENGIAIFELAGTSAGPRHLHYSQAEWIYVIHGEIELESAGRMQHLCAGDSVFIPRKVPHGWAPASDAQCRILNVYQPAGTIEQFYRDLAGYEGREKKFHEVVTFDEMHQFFHRHGMDVVGPPIVGEWTVHEDGRMEQIA